MSRVYVGNLDPRATEREVEDEFRPYGVLRSVWVAQKPPGFAFIEFEDRRDALDAIRALNGKNGWRVELSRRSGGGGGGGGPRGGRGRGGDSMKCYECGEAGHFARECSSRAGGGDSRLRARSRSPRYRGSPNYGRSGRSPVPRNYSTRRQSYSPPYQGRSGSPQPPREYLASPVANGSPQYKDRRRYRSRSP
eukprot:Gb_16463 [translate_table: standard]